MAVESWNQYTQHFGAFEGPGLLPYAVASFFENGGRRAYIVRIVHQCFKPDGNPDDAANGAGIARANFAELHAEGAREVWIAARNEGSWGNRLSITLSFTTSALALAPADFFVNRLRLPSGLKINPGTTLRLSIGGGVKVIRRIETVIDDWNADGSRERWAWLDLPTASAAHDPAV